MDFKILIVLIALTFPQIAQAQSETFEQAATRLSWALLHVEIQLNCLKAQLPICNDILCLAITENVCSCISRTVMENLSKDSTLLDTTKKATATVQSAADICSNKS